MDVDVCRSLENRGCSSTVWFLSSHQDHELDIYPIYNLHWVHFPSCQLHSMDPPNHSPSSWWCHTVQDRKLSECRWMRCIDEKLKSTNSLFRSLESCDWIRSWLKDPNLRRALTALFRIHELIFEFVQTGGSTPNYHKLQSREIRLTASTQVFIFIPLTLSLKWNTSVIFGLMWMSLYTSTLLIWFCKIRLIFSRNNLRTVLSLKQEREIKEKKQNKSALKMYIWSKWCDHFISVPLPPSLLSRLLH